MIGLITLGIVLMIIGIVLLVISLSVISDKGPIWLIGCLMGIVIFVIGAILTSINVNRYDGVTNRPEQMYQRLLNNLDKAEKDLQKFYIDYPEFKEIEE